MHVRNIICHVNKGRRMHVNKAYAHVRTSYSVEAAEVVRVGFVLMALAIPVLSVAADDVASDGGDCDAA